MNEKQKDILRNLLETAMGTLPHYNLKVTDKGAGVELQARTAMDGTILIAIAVTPQKANEVTIPFNSNHTAEDFGSRQAA